MRLSLLLALTIALPGCGGGCGESNIDEIAPSGKPEAAPPPKFTDSDWPWWRGANRDGKATGNYDYPLKFSKTESVVWKADVPGHGLSSPIVIGNSVILTTAERQSGVQSVLCYNRDSGKLKWRKDVLQGSLGSQGHNENSYASPTPACDGESIYAVFRHNGAIIVTALDMDGNQLWQTEVGRNDARHGYGSSPVIYKELVIISSDSGGKSFVATLNRKGGKIYWRRPRPSVASYATPVVANVAGKDQLLLSGGKQIISYDPMTGEKNWTVNACAETTCGTIVWNDKAVFASGGYPEDETVAIAADGSEKILWKNNRNFYVPSMILVDGNLHGFNRRGQSYSFSADDGNSNSARVRVSGGCYGSPVLAGGRLYVPGRNGIVHVLEPKTLKKLATNTMGSAMDTTPTPAGGRLYLRVVDGGQDVLYCVGKSGSSQ